MLFGCRLGAWLKETTAFGAVQAPARSIRPFGAASPAASPSWALAPDPVLAMGLFRAVVVPSSTDA
eukprot:8693947-Alexandrium_andersonii.AAC.1